MTGKPTGVGHSQNPQLDLTSPSSYAPYFENVQCRGLYPNIIVLEWLPHTLNNFQLDRNFQKKFSPFCRNFQKHIQAAVTYEPGTCLSKSGILHPSDH